MTELELERDFDWRYDDKSKILECYDNYIRDGKHIKAQFTIAMFMPLAERMSFWDNRRDRGESFYADGRKYLEENIEKEQRDWLQKLADYESGHN